MAINYTWSISELEYSNDETNGVSAVHWRCNAEEDQRYFADTYGQVSLEYDASSENFVAYTSLTEEIVLNWVYNHESINKTDIETQLETLINSQKTPEILTGRPWDVAPIEGD